MVFAAGSEIKIYCFTKKKLLYKELLYEIQISIRATAYI